MNPEMGWLKRVRCAVRLRSRVREYRNRLLRRVGLRGQEWKQGLPEEIQAWEQMLKDGGRCWIQSEYQQRIDPNFELQEEFKRLIGPRSDNTNIRILDVGAGPLTSVGKRWGGQPVQLFAVDPLAEEYKVMLTRLGIHPPVVSQLGYGERLLEIFEKNYFDLAIASNALDHSYDPMLAIRQMFIVVKPQCYVYLGHFANEGITAGFTGLHQWNFNIRRGDLILSDGRGRKYSVACEFEDLGILV
jgi:SAM-dependent methyltransferase